MRLLIPVPRPLRWPRPPWRACVRAAPWWEKSTQAPNVARWVALKRARVPVAFGGGGKRHRSE
jgi:hypothetical protein